MSKQEKIAWYYEMKKIIQIWTTLLTLLDFTYLFHESIVKNEHKRCILKVSQKNFMHGQTADVKLIHSTGFAVNTFRGYPILASFHDFDGASIASKVFRWLFHSCERISRKYSKGPSSTLAFFSRLRVWPHDEHFTYSAPCHCSVLVASGVIPISADIEPQYILYLANFPSGNYLRWSWDILECLGVQ